MRILADENVPGPVVVGLRDAGHDVLWVKEVMAGATDQDFGELAVRSGLPAESGVILFRLGGSTPDVDNARAVSALSGRDDWAGHFSVVTDDRIRLRPLVPGR